MKLNNIECPSVPGRGRAFPFKEGGPQFAGPINIGGDIYVIKVWENRTQDDRKYLRFIMETIEESGFQLIE